MTTEVDALPKQDGNGGATIGLSDSAKAEIAQLVRRAAAEHKVGKLAAVQKTLEAILEIDPQHAESLFNLAILARDRKEISNAERLFRRAIHADPLRVDAYHGLGELLLNARHLMLAIAIFRKGLEVAPTRVPLMSSLARCYLQLRKPRQVVEQCRQILDIFPDDTEALWLLAWGEFMLAEVRSALDALDRLDRIVAPHARSMALRQLCLDAIGEEQAAATLFDRLIEMTFANWADVKHAIEVYAWSGRPKQSYDIVQRFILAHPESPVAIQELCTLKMNDGLFHEVQEDLAAVLRLQPESLYVRMVNALSSFRIGDYEGFHRDHESRWARDTHEGKWELPVPLWDGKPLADKALLIYSEQGIGDHVMYGGFFADLRAYAKRISIDTSARLIGLFQRSFPDVTFIDRNQLPPNWMSQEFGGIAPYGDLPTLMKSDFEHLASRDGYLVPDPTNTQKLRRRYQEKFPGKKLIGISWRSGNRDSAVIRSVDLPHWMPIFDVPGYAFVSLQYGSIEDDLADLKKDFGVDVYRDPEIDPMSVMDPFAAQLAAMDLVISADNSTVHFAGALGIPCWLMLPVNSDWRWQLGRDDSIWYASLLLFRSRRELGGDWGPVIADIARHLAQLEDTALTAARAKWLQRCMQTMDHYQRTADAEEFARQLLELDAHVGEAMRVIGVAAMKTGVTSDAVQILSRAAALQPGDAHILGDLVVALDANGDAQQAERLGRDALRQTNDNIHLLSAMGKVLTRQNRYDEATDYFARILRQRPDDIDARQSLARLQLLEGEPDLARLNLEKALSFDNNARTAHMELSEIMLRASHHPAAAWEHFRWRFPERPGEMPRHLAMVDPDLRPTVWTGGKLRRQRLMLRAERTTLEQMLFMCRFNEIIGTARPVLMEIDPRFIPMLNLDVRKMDVRPAGAADPQAIVADRIQLIASLGDLASQIADNLVPGRAVPSLAPDGALVSRYRQSYQAALPGRKLVGLSWREPGAPAGLVLMLAQIVPFLMRQDFGIILLQSDMSADEGRALSEIAGRELPGVRFSHKALDIPDLAAQISALDLVVAAEELTAHISAASGVRTVKLCGGLSHWAWGDRSGPCLWYPDAQSIHLRSVEDVAALPERIAGLLGSDAGTR